MNSTIGTAIIGLMMVAINYVVLFMIFPRRYNRAFSYTAVIMFVAVYYSLLVLTEKAGVTLGGFRGLIHFPLIMLLFRGQFFQKTFATFYVMLVSGLQYMFVKAAAVQFAPAESNEYYPLLIIILLVVYTLYVCLMLKFGRRFFERLFIDGRRVEWVLYSLGALFSFTIMSILMQHPIEMWQQLSVLLFILWSFAILCFAIINTHEKARQTYETELARDIISSGREHFHKMDGMYGKLRMLRHNYKYHLSTVSELLRSGNMDEVRAYLTDAETELSESELTVYCPNTVINALLVSYAERCARLDIKYNVKVTMPDTLSIPNYEMCIILGNLLENAVEACQKQNDSRWVRLLIKPAGAQLVVKVTNSFNGVVAQENGQPVTTKKDGGLGHKSVQAVAAKYEGELLTKWDDKTFTAYVLMWL